MNIPCLHPNGFLPFCRVTHSHCCVQAFLFLMTHRGQLKNMQNTDTDAWSRCSLLACSCAARRTSCLNFSTLQQDETKPSPIQNSKAKMIGSWQQKLLHSSKRSAVEQQHCSKWALHTELTDTYTLEKLERKTRQTKQFSCTEVLDDTDQMRISRFPLPNKSWQKLTKAEWSYTIYFMLYESCKLSPLYAIWVLLIKPTSCYTSHVN